MEADLGVNKTEPMGQDRMGSMFGNGCVMFPLLPIVKLQLIISVAVGLLTLTTVVLRIVNRVYHATLGWDDYLILFALPQGMALIIIQGLWSPMGVGYPVTETGPNLTHFFKLLFAFEMLYTTSISTIKLSVLSFYLRVFFANSTLHRATKATAAIVCAWTVANVLQVSIICRTFVKLEWAPGLIHKAVCSKHIASYVAIGSFNIITDVVILVLPLPILWKLDTSRATKSGLTIIFFMGLGVSIIAIVRIGSLLAIRLGDLTETMMWPEFWSVMEPNLGILCVSLPMLNRMFGRCISRRARPRPRPRQTRLDSPCKMSHTCSAGDYSPDKEFFSQTVDTPPAEGVDCDLGLRLVQDVEGGGKRK